MIRPTLLERFTQGYIPEPNSGCWIWVKSTNNKGYGVLWADGKLRLATRISYKIHNGDPGGLNVCHTCDTPQCVNPEHFFLGTQKENFADARAKGRLIGRHDFIRDHCSRGHKYPPDVRIVRVLSRAHGVFTSARVCRECIKIYNRRYRSPEWRKNSDS